MCLMAEDNDDSDKIGGEEGNHLSIGTRKSAYV